MQSQNAISVLRFLTAAPTTGRRMPPHDIVPLPLGHAAGAILCLGNFDGFHRGHHSVIATAQAIAAQLEVPAAIMSCEPHPRSFFAPENRKPFRLFSPRQKRAFFPELGMGYLYEPRFDASFANLEAEDFLETVLLQELQVGGLVCGADFRFGARRRGDPEMLQRFCARHGLTCAVLAKVLPASSTGIRNALLDGQPEIATEQLGRPWKIDFYAGRIQIRPAPGRYLVRDTETGETHLMQVAEDSRLSIDGFAHLQEAEILSRA